MGATPSNARMEDPQTLIHDNVFHDNVMNMCRGSVAVVGNGPLDEHQRYKINSEEYSCVVRFNDMKNAADGDRTDIVATRSSGKGGVRFPLPKSVPTNVKILPIVPTLDDASARFRKGDYMVMEPLFVYEQKFEGKAVDSAVFEECDMCQSTGLCNHSAARDGPSSGCVVIDALNSSSNVDKIHVYGMNWNVEGGNPHHIDFSNPDLVPGCCDKCVVHPTPHSGYLA